MKVLIDTNIIIDLLSTRDFFYDDSCKIFQLSETKLIDGNILTLDILNTIYILRKELDNDKIESIINTLSNICTINDYTLQDIKNAVKLNFNDFEDAIHSTVAERKKFDYIITRNVKDFQKSNIPAILPSDFIKLINNQS